MHLQRFKTARPKKRFGRLLVLTHLKKSDGVSLLAEETPAAYLTCRFVTIRHTIIRECAGHEQELKTMPFPQAGRKEIALILDTELS